MQKDLGFLIFKLTNNVFCDRVMSCAEQISISRPFDQIVVFNSFCDKTKTNNIPILHLNHAKFFKGDLLIFDLIGIVLSQNFPNISKRYLYVTDIPWLSSPQTLYSEWSKLYMAENVELIVSNEKLFDIYKLTWKKPIGICEDFNYEKIQNLI